MNFSEYIEHLTTFSDDELKYMLEDKNYPEGVAGMISESAAMRCSKSNLYIIRHIWNTVAMYHSLAVYKLCYVYNGNFFIHTDDSKPIRLKQGDMCIVAPGIMQKFTIDYSIEKPESRNDNVLINVMFPVHATEQLFAPLLSCDNPVSEYLSLTLHEKNHKKYMILRSPGEFNRALAEQAFYETYRMNEDKCDEISADLLMNLLLLDYVKKKDFVCEYSLTDVSNNDIFPHIMDCIHANFNTITLDGLCGKFHYTPSYVCKLIKKKTGLTFKEYLTNERLDFVCKQLALTNKSIKKIIAKSGYISEEHFYRVFKKKIGITPLEYRRQFFDTKK